MAGVRLVAQRYRLEERLGSGGMGVVWRATDLELRRVVALKRSQDGDGGQIRREARIGASLHHPHVVTVFDSVTDGDDQWLVMEYLPARSLELILRTDGPLPAPRVAGIGAQVADALVAMHAKDMVHRDITPGNILVADDGTAKLADLGISRWAEVTVTGGAQVGGTAGYIAPEVAEGHEAGTAADMFSLGATLFAAIEGVSPWGTGEQGPFAQLRRAADFTLEPARHTDALTPLLQALLSRKPGQRPNAAEARTQLAGEAGAYARSGTGSAWSGSAMASRRPVRRALGKHRKTVIAGALLAVVALAGAFVAFRGDQAPQANPPVNLLGDPATADPCSLLTANSLSSYGKTFVDPNLGHFNACNLDTTLPAGSGTIVTTVELQAPEEYPSEPPTPGRLSSIVRPNADPAKCERCFTLPDLTKVDVSAVRNDRNPSDQLCSMANAVADDAYARVVSGPLGRRPYAFSPDSLAHIDACTLLDQATLDSVVGKDYPVDRYFENWSCSWGHDDTKSVDLYYDRAWPLAGSPPDPGSTRVELGNHLAEINPYTDGGEDDECGITLVYRTYQPKLPTIDGEPAQREETLLLEYTDKVDKAGLDSICATARSVASVVAARLPKA